MKNITEEMRVHEDWYNEARNITIEKLPEFIKKLTTEYEHDYGTICHAIASSAIATCWAIDKSPQGGITGFQAGAIMWEFIRNWMYSMNELGLKIINYDDLMYPQNRERFEKTISQRTWEKLKYLAKNELDKVVNGEQAHPDVIAHWRSIVDDVVPFGFVVK